MSPHNLQIYLYNIDNNTLSPLLYNDTNLDNDWESLSFNLDNYDDSFNYKILFFIHQDVVSFSDVGFDDIVYRIDDDSLVAFVSETSPFTFILQGRQTTPDLAVLANQETAFVRVTMGNEDGKVNINDTPKNTGLIVYNGQYLYFEGSQAFTNDVYLLSDVIPARTSPTTDDDEPEPPQITPSGGTISYADGYTIHTFTSSGEFLISENVNVDYMVIGGGGGGGCGGFGGGGGAGTFMEGIGFNTGGGSVVIGGGGSGATFQSQRGGNGSNSSFGSIVANGGGGGGSRADNHNSGLSGGSGGGGARLNGNRGLTNQADGGNHGGNGRANGGGGGGSGGVGQDGTENHDNVTGRNGGDGRSSEISGTLQFYSAGGGGGSALAGNSASVIGGKGGGNNIIPTSGLVNTGSGGGGGGIGSSEPGAGGGSGIVIIRYVSNVSPN
jgi:hypothetical protein